MTKLAYTFDVNTETGEITNIKPKYTTDGCRYEMQDFHGGLEDLEYDRDVPEDFGK